MSPFVTALFDNHAQARSALQALIEMGVARNHIVAIGLDDGTDVSSISGFRSLSARDDAGAALDDLNLPADERNALERGIRSGCALVGGQVDRSDLDKAIDTLEMFDPVDLDSGSRERLQDRPPPKGEPGGPLGAGLTGGVAADGLGNAGALPGMGAMIDASDDLGTGDLRAGETPQGGPGAPSTVSTGDRRDDRRAGREGVTEMNAGSAAPAPRNAPRQRDTNRGGRVWAFGTRDS